LITPSFTMFSSWLLRSHSPGFPLLQSFCPIRFLHRYFIPIYSLTHCCYSGFSQWLSHILSLDLCLIIFLLFLIPSLNFNQRWLF
jgi:hypothetical protein